MFNLSRIRCNNKGLTVIEFIIAFALLNFVLMLVYSSYFVGFRSFQSGEEKSNVQRNIRIAVTFITKEIRNATELVLVDAPPSTSVGDGYHYIYLAEEKPGLYSILHRTPDGEIISRIQPVLSAITPMFELSQLENGANIIALTLQAANSNYYLETTINLRNISGITDAGDQVIKYRKP
ncbi:MAG: hypothetical protein KGZ63_03665 [Clostridiales bacterium]|nr:hypothetical protein [Clostridiales bacterium]